jgi:hypothetical protein
VQELKAQKLLIFYFLDYPTSIIGKHPKPNLLLLKKTHLKEHIIGK